MIKNPEIIGLGSENDVIEFSAIRFVAQINSLRARSIDVLPFVLQAFTSNTKENCESILWRWLVVGELDLIEILLPHLSPEKVEALKKTTENANVVLTKKLVVA